MSEPNEVSAWEPPALDERLQLLEDARVLAENARMYASTEPMGNAEASALIALADGIKKIVGALEALEKRGAVP